MYVFPYFLTNVGVILNTARAPPMCCLKLLFVRGSQEEESLAGCSESIFKAIILSYDCSPRTKIHQWRLSQVCTVTFAAELMMAEAEGLVNTLENWTVVDKMILSTKTPEKKRIFGKGNFQTLTGMIHSGESEGLDQVLLTCELPAVSPQRGSGKQQESLLCSSMLSVWLLCLRWACLKTLAVLDERFLLLMFLFLLLYFSYSFLFRGTLRKSGGSKCLTDTQ